jgi:AcrR family transcriptional regulator
MSTAERRARELERRERSLLDAAVALLDRDDWQAVTVEAIADRAEYAKGTVYRHFASKDDLYARLAAEWIAGTCDALEALDADRPFEAVLRDLVAVALRRMTADRVHARLLARVGQADFRRGLSPEARRGLDESNARLLGLFAGTIDWGVAEGAIPRAPLEPRLFVVAALLRGAAGLADQADIPDPGRAVADAVLAAMRAG